MDRLRDRPGKWKQACEQLLREVKHVVDLGLGYHERVTLANRSNIEEGQVGVVLTEDVCGNLARDDADLAATAERIRAALAN